MTQPLMPMATAVWLIDNTTLNFKQIAKFCGLHELEIQALADEYPARIVGIDPVQNGQLSAENIKECEADPKGELKLLAGAVPEQRRTKGPRYTPVSKRQDKPDAIAWLLRHHPELSDGQICRLVGTTKATITQIRDRAHWNIQNIKPQDPVGLGLSTQSELDEAVARAAKRRGEPVEPAPEPSEVPEFTGPTTVAEAESEEVSE